MDDAWVCSTCKSLNRRRDDRCYKCHGPREVAMPTEGPSTRLTSAAINRQVRDYLPSWPLAALAGGLIVAVSLLGIVILVREASGYGQLKEAFLVALAGNTEAIDSALAEATAGSTGVGLVHLGLSGLALLCFAAWLAVATMNVPALGGGIPPRGPIRVFVYTLIPLWNLVKVPPMVHDVLYRLDPEAGGFFLVIAAWIGLIGARFVSWFGSWFITFTAIQAVFAAPSLEEASAAFGAMLDQTFALGIVVEVMIAVGAILLVVLMARIERRAMLRDREIRAAVASG
jgi:hypothetical protein